MTDTVRIWKRCESSLLLHEEIRDAKTLRQDGAAAFADCWSKANSPILFTRTFQPINWGLNDFVRRSLTVDETWVTITCFKQRRKKNLIAYIA